MLDSNCCLEPVFCAAAVEEDCSGGHVIEVFDDLDKVGTYVVLLHGCPQSFMPNPVKCFHELKSMKTWQRFCWCWRYFSQRIRRLKICSVVLFPALKPACSLAMISACGPQSVQNDLQHDCGTLYRAVEFTTDANHYKFYLQ